MKLFVNEPSARSVGAIEVHDADHNDIAEFFHNEHATVEQSYDTALALARKLTAPNELDAAWEAVNALGGTGSTPEELAFIYGIERALDAIETLGGMDPKQRTQAA